MDSRHTLVIVLIIALIEIGFYDFASPFENCQREYLENKNLYDVRAQVN
jgi:hypothetical protein